MPKLLVKPAIWLALPLPLGLFFVLVWPSLDRGFALGEPLILAGIGCLMAFHEAKLLRDWEVGPTVRFLIALIAALAFASTCYAMWARYRASAFVLSEDAHWPRDWPFPDWAVWGLNDWYDRRHPVPADTLKIHGEFPTVRLALDILILILSTVTGLSLGMSQAESDRGRSKG